MHVEARELELATVAENDEAWSWAELTADSDGEEARSRALLWQHGSASSGGPWHRSTLTSQAWGLCSRCILLDLTYFFVWSRFLAFTCLLTATLLLGEEGFYSIFRLPSSSSCRWAHSAGSCSANGHRHLPNGTMVFTLNPVESLQLHVELPGIWALRLVLAVSVANSRYLRCWSSKVERCYSALVLLFCLLHALGSAVDLHHCGSGSSPTGDLESTWGMGLQNWTGPAEEARQILQYCNVDHLRGIPATEKDRQRERRRQRLQMDAVMTESVRNMWAAWVDAVVFEVSLANRTRLAEYCRSQLGIPSLRPCLAWLNSSAHGNAIQCPEDRGLQPFGPERLQELASSLAAASMVDVSQSRYERLALLDSLVLEADLDSLALRACEARVNGSAFGLRAPSPLGGVASPETVGKHLLAVAARGVGCDSVSEVPGSDRSPSSAATVVPPATGMAELGVGIAWAGALGSGCSRSEYFWNVDPPELLEESAPYLRLEFFTCVADVFQDCAERALSAQLTTFRSGCQFLCSLGLLLAYARMLAGRHLHWRVSDLAVVAGGRSSTVLPAVLAGWRIFFGSRVLVGLLAAGVLQLGCTVILGRLVDAWARQGSGVALAKSLQLLPETLLERLACLFIWLQCFVVLAAILCNVLLHLRLRHQLFELPREVFFGKSPAPPGYRGPDLQDLRRMGRSTLVYAMYFPGILFWNFFYGSCMLVSIALSLVGSLVVVLQPGERRSPYAADMWPWLVNLVFFCSILLAHFLTRLFTQQCLLWRHDRGLRIRCLCLWSWYELMTFSLSFAVGPLYTLWDFLKGFLCTALASLIIQKPNFTQFGELADYVYCTYCSALYLERVAHDREMRHALSETAPEEDPEPCLYEEPAQKFCLWQFVVFWLLFTGLPCLTAWLADRASAALGYPCPAVIGFLPRRGCDAAGDNATQVEGDSLASLWQLAQMLTEK